MDINTLNIIFIVIIKKKNEITWWFQISIKSGTSNNGESWLHFILTFISYTNNLIKKVPEKYNNRFQINLKPCM